MTYEDVRPPVLGNGVHLARPDRSCWAGIVVAVRSDRFDPRRLVALQLFPPPEHRRWEESWLPDNVKFDGTGKPGTWHHHDTRPVHDPDR